MTRKSSTLFAEYEPENNRWVLKDTEADENIIVVPNDGNGKAKLRTAISEPSDVSSERDFDTEYENTDDFSRFVSITLESDGTQEISASLNIGNNSGNLERIDSVLVHGEDLSEPTRVTLGPVEIPPGGFYDIGLGSNNESTIQFWNEWNRS